MFESVSVPIIRLIGGNATARMRLIHGANEEMEGGTGISEQNLSQHDEVV